MQVWSWQIGPADGDREVYLIIRVFLCNTGLDVTHEGVDEAMAISHGLSGFQFATAQVPKEIIFQ